MLLKIVSLIIIYFVLFGLLFALIYYCRKYYVPKKWKKFFLGIPYDFSRPTWKKAKDRLWNQEAPMFTLKLFGWGWGLNFRNPWSWMFLTIILGIIISAVFLVNLYKYVY